MITKLITVKNKTALALLSFILMTLTVQCEKPTDSLPPGNQIAPSEQNQGKGGLLQGSYNLQGTFTANETGIQINSDYMGTTAPGPVWYLSNNSRSIVGGVSLGTANKTPGAYMLKTTLALEYDYLIMWCDPFSVYIGGGRIPK